MSSRARLVYTWVQSEGVQGGGCEGGLDFRDPPGRRQKALTVGRQGSILLKTKYSESSYQELLVGICMGPVRGGGGWWVVGGGFDLLGPPLQDCSGPLLQNSEYIIGFLSSRTGYWHPLVQLGKRGVCVHGWESVPCAQGFGQQEVWRRTCCRTTQTSRIVTMYDLLLHGEVRRASSAGQLLPHNSAATQPFKVVDMQMDRDFKEEQIGTLIEWGRWKGGFGGE
eukprot:866632-Pelagomonas_calceolata.AAC.3